MSRILLINGLETIFSRKFPIKTEDGIIYSLHKKFIFKSNENNEVSHFKMRHPIENFLFYCFTDVDKEKARDILLQSESYYSRDKQEIYFPYNIYCLANFFKPDKIIDLNGLALKFNDFNSLESDENRDKIINKLWSFLEDIREDDIILYSLHKISGSVLSILNSNLKILSYLRDITRNIYIGGEFLETLNLESLQKFKDYHLCRGKNLDLFKFSKKIQDLSIQLPYKIQEYKYNETFDPLNLYECDVEGVKIKSFVYILNKNHYCNGVCAFCTNSSTGIKDRSIGNIESSFEGFKSFVDSGFNGVTIIDPHITDKRLFYRFSDFILKNNFKLNICAGVRLKDVTYQSAKLLKDIGVKIANIGIETIDNSQLKYIRKNITIEEIEEKIKILDDNGIFINANFIVDMPYSPYEEISKIIEWIDKKFPEGTINGSVFSLFQLYFDSDFRRYPEKFNITLLPFSVENHSIYLENNSKINSKKRKNILGNEFIKYFKITGSHNCVDFDINLIFALFNKFRDKKLVWEEYKKKKDL